jgi:hypothetical protein
MRPPRYVYVHAACITMPVTEPRLHPLVVVRNLVLATLQAGHQRLADADAQLHELVRLLALVDGGVSAVEGDQRPVGQSVDSGQHVSATAGSEAAVAAREALMRLRTLLKTPLTPLNDPMVEELATEHKMDNAAANATRLGELASAVQVRASSLLHPVPMK